MLPRVQRGRANNLTHGHAGLQAIVGSVREIEVERRGLTGPFRVLLKHWWVNPGCLGLLDSVLDIALKVAFGARELSCGKLAWDKGRGTGMRW